MANGQSFSEILKEQMGVRSSQSSRPVFEEGPSLWVQVLPFLRQKNLSIKKKSPYTKSSSSIHFQSKTEPPVAPLEVQPETLTPPPPPPEPCLDASELSPLETGLIELLIRKKWLARKDHYSLSEWKKAHRRAVRALHPDSGSNKDASEFSLVHEAFKEIEGLFKL